MGATGRSYIIGYGKNPPRNPHHRNAALTLKESGSWDLFKDPNHPTRNELIGAMVGGPGLDDGYVDVRTDYQKNEVWFHRLHQHRVLWSFTVAPRTSQAVKVWFIGIARKEHCFVKLGQVQCTVLCRQQTRRKLLCACGEREELCRSLWTTMQRS